MNLRITGLVEITVIVAAMAFGAIFVFLAYQLGNATRPGEMAAWNTAGEGSGTTTSPPSSSVPAPSPASGTSTASGATAGKAVFEKSCNGCHPGRKQGVGPALDESDLKQKYPDDGDLVKVIRGGRGIMPAFSPSTISDGDLKSVIEYLRSAP